MKKYLKNVYAGISAEYNEEQKRYQFKVDFENNSKEDIIKFLKPFDTKLDDHVYWFGYKYNEGIENNELRKQFIEFMKNVQEDSTWDFEEDGAEACPTISPFYLTESDLNAMMIRALNRIGLTKYNVDTVLYSQSTHNLVRMMVKCIKSYLKDADKMTFVELKKLAANQVKLDRKQFVKDLYDNEPALQGMTIDTIYELSENLEELGDTLFSMREHIHPKALRKYVRNIFAIESAEALQSANKVLVIDDFKTSGTTIREMIDQLEKCNNNPDLEIYIFTLMGNFNQ